MAHVSPFGAKIPIEQGKIGLLQGYTHQTSHISTHFGFVVHHTFLKKALFWRYEGPPAATFLNHLTSNGLL